MTVIVEVPGHGEVEFPDGMTDAQMDAAIRKNFMMPPKQAPKAEMKPSKLGQAAMAAGRGLITGGPMGMVAGAGTEMLKQQGEALDAAAYDAGGKVTDLTGSPELGFAANVATQAIPSILGGKAATAVAPTLQAGGRALMQSALKPTVKDIRTGKASRAIDTLLEEGINPTKGGVEVLQTKVADLGDEIDKAVSASSMTINKGDVGKRIQETYNQFKNQVNPQSDLDTIKKAWVGFRDHPLLIGKQEIPVQVAQDMKQGTYTQLRKKYGEMGSADTEAQKSLARGLKEEISAAVPEVAPLNAKQGELLNALTVSERRALMDLNKNPMGLALLSHNPAGWAAFMADKSALFKSVVARMLHSGSERLPQAAGTAGTGALMAPSGQEQGVLYRK